MAFDRLSLDMEVTRGQAQPRGEFFFVRPTKARAKKVAIVHVLFKSPTDRFSLYGVFTARVMEVNGVCAVSEGNYRSFGGDARGGGC